MQTKIIRRPDNLTTNETEDQLLTELNVLTNVISYLQHHIQQ